MIGWAGRVSLSTIGAMAQRTGAIAEHGLLLSLQPRSTFLQRLPLHPRKRLPYGDGYTQDKGKNENDPDFRAPPEKPAKHSADPEELPYAGPTAKPPHGFRVAPLVQRLQPLGADDGPGRWVLSHGSGSPVGVSCL